jgi:hypothetical protein
MLLAVRRGEGHDIAFVLPDKSARNRRCIGDQAGADISFVFAYDPVNDLLLGFLLEQFDGGTEYDFPARVNGRDVNHLDVGELALEVLDARFDETLLLLGCVVLSVLLEITMRTSLRNRLDHIGTIYGLESFQLILYQLVTA